MADQDSLLGDRHWPAVPVTRLDVRPDVELNPWTDIEPDPAKVLHGGIERIGLLRNGTSQGRASVAIVVRLDDGRVVIGETTWRLFNTAGAALAASPVAAEEA